MPKMNGGQALIKSLYNAGIRTVFGIPGAGQYEAIDALYMEPNIRYISTRNEQVIPYMADGYARASGKIAAALVVQGPGLFNATAGLASAYAASSPVLVITGNRHQRDFVDQDPSWMRPFCKWGARADSPAEIPAIVQEAMQQLHSGCPRPVVIEISAKVFADRTEVNLIEPEIPTPPPSDTTQLEQAVQLLVQARKPVIWAGAGVVRAGASPVLQALAEHLQAPVVTTRQGKGALSDKHPLSLGLAELRFTPLRNWLGERDVILAVGTSTDFSTHPQQVIHIDIEPGQIGQSPNICPVVAHAQQALDVLYTQVSSTLSPAAPIADEVKAINLKRFDPVGQLQPQWDLMRAIRTALPEDGIVTQGMNQMGYYSRNYFPTYRPRTYLTASSLATLGSAFPLAVGAKVAMPDKAVVALCGDGGFLYTPQELATAVQYGINLVVIVFNDNAYGNVLRAQMEEFDGHVLGTQLHNPDFVKLAEAYGARGLLAQDSAQLEAALKEAFEVEAPTLIEVPVGPMDRVY